MNRRQFLSASQPILMASLAGCGGEYVGNDPPAQIVRVRGPHLHQGEDACKLRVEIELVQLGGGPIEVEMLAYADDGSLICREDFGTLDPSKTWLESVETKCPEPPTIVTVRTDPSVCDNINVELRYWIDEANADEKNPPGYHVFDRACDESLPPERFVNRGVEPPPCNVSNGMPDSTTKDQDQ